MSKSKTLSLSRETLRLLSASQAADVNGGVSGVWQPTTGPACPTHTANAQSCVVVPAHTQRCTN